AAETLEHQRYHSAEEERRFQRMIINEINRLNHLVHKILSYSKIEMGQIQFHEQEVDLRRIIEHSLEVFQVQAAADGVDLVVETSEDPCPIQADADLVRQAIDNIVDNAFKYR